MFRAREASLVSLGIAATVALCLPFFAATVIAARTAAGHQPFS